MTESSIVFFRTGWMHFYEGPKLDSATIGNSDYLKKHKFGHELYNFERRRGRCYGCAVDGKRTNIVSLGAQSTDEFIDGVLVIWVAIHPDLGRPAIVGWYRNARVYRDFQMPPTTCRRRANSRPVLYKARATASDCHLLPVAERTFLVPTFKDMQGGMGQSHVWYAKGLSKFQAQVRRYVATGEIPPSRLPNRKHAKSGAARQSDTEKRLKVERVSMTHAKAHYKRKGYAVEDVSSRARGWDLEATLNKLQLQVEVKGLSGNDIVVELTPNEFKKMRSRQYRDTYVVYVVTDCLGNSPRGRAFMHDMRAESWQSPDGINLHVGIVESARLSAR